MFKLSAQVLFENGKTIKEFLLISNSFIREYATLSLAKDTQPLNLKNKLYLKLMLKNFLKYFR